MITPRAVDSEAACLVLDNLVDRRFATREDPAEPLYQLISRLEPAAVRDFFCAATAVSADELIAIINVDSALGAETGRWLGSAVRQMSDEQRGDLLYLVTAARCLPSRGDHPYGHKLRFNLARSATAAHLPVAHTCSNTVDLPRYPSFEVLQAKLLEAMAVGRHQGGFQLS